MSTPHSSGWRSATASVSVPRRAGTAWRDRGETVMSLLPLDWEHALVKRNQLKRQRRSAPSPLVGEGWGGGSLLLHEICPPTTTPTPNPSPQGGGECTECVATTLRRIQRAAHLVGLT